MLSELLNLPTAELAHRLATVAVEARARKVAAAKQAAGMFDQAVAGAKDLWSSAQPTLQAYGNSLKNLDVSNPAVAATLGAAALGGPVRLGSRFRPVNGHRCRAKCRRRKSDRESPGPAAAPSTAAAVQFSRRRGCIPGSRQGIPS